MKFMLIVVLSLLVCAFVTGQRRLIQDDRDELGRIRNDISILTENIRGLQNLTASLRSVDLPAARLRLRMLRNNDTTTDQELQDAREAIQNLREEVNENISSRLEERNIVQCLRGCIRTFYMNQNREMLTTCEVNCA